MIIPWIKGFLGWAQVPLTWTLLALNIFVFLFTYEPQKATGTHSFSNVESLVLTGKLFEQFKNPKLKTLPLKTQNEWILLGGLGLRHAEFIDAAGTFSFFGDQIAIQKWRQNIREYRSQMSSKATSIFGLSAQSRSPLTWITYQFMHAGWIHLIGNMLMFLIFGAALEMTVGGLGLILIYLLGGVVGAWAFLGLSHGTLAPMIGASGSLSAVMAFYALYEKKRRVAFFYFISPLPGYYGWIYLPTILILPLCFLSDFAGYFGTSPELGNGIAYTAHIGGAVFGGVFGFCLRFFRRSIWVRWISQH